MSKLFCIYLKLRKARSLWWGMVHARSLVIIHTQTKNGIYYDVIPIGDEYWKSSALDDDFYGKDYREWTAFTLNGDWLNLNTNICGVQDSYHLRCEKFSWKCFRVTWCIHRKRRKIKINSRIKNSNTIKIELIITDKSKWQKLRIHALKNENYSMSYKHLLFFLKNEDSSALHKRIFLKVIKSGELSLTEKETKTNFRKKWITCQPFLRSAFSIVDLWFLSTFANLKTLVYSRKYHSRSLKHHLNQDITNYMSLLWTCHTT